MTGEIGNQVAFLLMTIALFAGLGMWFYNPKQYEEDYLSGTPKSECVGVLIHVK